MSVGVMKDYKLNKEIYAPPIHWVLPDSFFFLFRDLGKVV
jgi:hypothetical protein